jgi:hypothetical protein
MTTVTMTITTWNVMMRTTMITVTMTITFRVDNDHNESYILPSTFYFRCTGCAMGWLSRDTTDTPPITHCYYISSRNSSALLPWMEVNRKCSNLLQPYDVGQDGSNLMIAINDKAEQVTRRTSTIKRNR